MLHYFELARFVLHEIFSPLLRFPRAKNYAQSNKPIVLRTDKLAKQKATGT